MTSKLKWALETCNYFIVLQPWLTPLLFLPTYYVLFHEQTNLVTSCTKWIFYLSLLQNQCDCKDYGNFKLLNRNLNIKSTTHWVREKRTTSFLLVLLVTFPSNSQTSPPSLVALLILCFLHRCSKLMDWFLMYKRSIDMKFRVKYSHQWLHDQPFHKADFLKSRFQMLPMVPYSSNNLNATTWKFIFPGISFPPLHKIHWLHMS